MYDSQDRDRISKPELIGLLLALGAWLLPNIGWVAIITIALLIVIGVYGVGSNRKSETNFEPSSWTTILNTVSLPIRRLIDNVIGFFTPSNPYPQHEILSDRLSQLPLATFLIYWGITMNKYLFSDFYDYRFLLLPIALLVILMTTKNQVFVANKYFRFFLAISLFPQVTLTNDFFMYSPIIAGLIIFHFSIFSKDGRAFKAPIASWLLAIHIFMMCFTYILDFDLVILYYSLPVTGLFTAIAIYKRI